MQPEILTLKTKNWVLLATICVLVLIAERFIQMNFWENPGGLFEMDLPVWYFLPIVAVGVLAHEFMHAFFFALFSEAGYQSISFDWKSYSPSCHCSEPLTKGQFMIAAIAPFLLVGLLPLVISYFLELPWLRNFGILFTIGGMADAWFFVVLLFKHSGVRILDHPTEVGILVECESDEMVGNKKTGFNGTRF